MPGVIPSSIDFTDNHQDVESLETFGPLLYGFALTNRPFVKGMKPVVQLSDDAEVPELSEKPRESEMATAIAPVYFPRTMQFRLCPLSRLDT